MLIQKGDLVKVEKGVILHQVNCLGVMGSGVALAVRKTFPIVYKEYMSYVKNKGFKAFGDTQIIEINPTLYVVNSYTQKEIGYGKKLTNESMLIDNIDKCNQFALEKGLQLFIPLKIGCVRGGGNWDNVLLGISLLKNSDNITAIEFNGKPKRGFL